MPMNPTKRPWYREPLVWMLIAIPAWAVAAGFTTLYLAVDSYDGLVVDDYYQHGKTINRVLARDRAARHYGLQSKIHLDYQNQRIHARMTARELKVLPDRLDLRLLHATRAGKDQDIVLQRTAAQRYEGVLFPLVPGHWYIELAADDWRLTGSLHVPQDHAVRLGSATQETAATRTSGYLPMTGPAP